MTAPNTAASTAAAVRAGEMTALAAAEAALARIVALNPALNAFACLDAPRTLAEAEAVDARIAAGEDLPLAGVPVAIKDNIWAAGWPATQGSRLFEGFEPPEDARAVALLRKAGAVIIGMATCSEFACKGLTNTPLHGITRNPADPDLTPGGSSGGPAAAVASGMVPLALGTDAGGSSRRPPAHVGCVGFKPSQDAIPYGPGFAEPFWGVSVLAPVAGDVADAALMFETLASGDTALAPAPADPRALSIALAPSFGLQAAMDAGMADALAAAVDALRAAGFGITNAAPDWPDGLDAMAVMPLQWAGLAAIHGAAWAKTPEKFDPDLGVQIENGMRLTGVAVAEALEASARMKRILRGFLSAHDLVIGATTPCPAWPVDQLGPATIGGAQAAPRDHAAFTAMFNHAGLPALSLPCGMTEGLPLGLQLGAGFGRDRAVLAAAAAFEPLFDAAGLWSPGPVTDRKAR